MKSLTDLNNYAGTSLAFTDPRPTTITFNTSTPVNQSITEYEYTAFTAPAGIEFTTIINAPEDITFQINVAGNPQATVSWGDLSTKGSGSLAASFANNVYSITGIKGINDWNVAKEASIITPDGYNGNWYYDNKIIYNGGSTKTWRTTVTTLPLEELTAPSDTFYSTYADNPILNYSQLANIGLPQFTTNATYTCNVTVSNTAVLGNLYNTSTLTTNSWNNTTKTLKMIGNSSAMNDALSKIYFYPKDGLEQTFLLNYSLYNNLSKYTTHRTQYVKPQTANYLSIPNATTYDKNVIGVITAAPTIVDTISNPNGTYTLTVLSNVSNNINSITSSSASGGTSTWNNTTKRLTVIGTKAQVNGHMANVSLWTGTDFTDSFYLDWVLSVPTGNVSAHLQQFHVANVSTTMGNLGVGRTFQCNTAPQAIFTNTTPFIAETISSNPTYHYYISSTAGQFGGDDGTYSRSYSVSGTKSQVNQAIVNTVFYPDKDVTGSQTLRFQMYRDAILETDQTINFTGSARPNFTYPGAGRFPIYSNGSFTPTFEQIFYQTANILLVGAGGTGGTAGGGGAGGQVLEVFGANLSPATYTVTIGQGSEQSGYFSYPDGAKIASGGGNTTIKLGSTELWGAAGGGGGTINNNSSNSLINNLRGGNTFIKSGSTKSVAHTGGVGVAVQGNPPPTSGSGSGGGGSSSAANGQTSTGGSGGNGANGVTSTIGNGTYGGGGGGWGTTTAGSGGTGGGAAGRITQGTANAGSANSGGGGGSNGGTGAGGNGGSGVVVFQFT